MSLKVLIGGGSGMIGQALTALLRKRGHTVTIVSRHKADQDGITWDEVKENGLPSSTDVVVNLAGHRIIDPTKRWNEEHKRELTDSRIKTTEMLRDAIISAEVKPKVWLSISAIGFYVSSHTAVYDEYSKAEKGDFFNDLVQRWEEVSEIPSKPESIRHVIARPGMVLGHSKFMSNLISQHKFCLGGPIGTGKQWFSWIHIDDMAEMLVYAIENERVTGILNGVAPNPVRYEDFSRELARILWRPNFFRMPEFALKLILGQERAAFACGGLRVVPTRALELGFKFTYTHLSDALQQLVEQHRV